MRKHLFRLLTIGFLLAMLCLSLQSSPASAQTNTVAFPFPPSTQYTSIVPTYYGATFIPGYVTCHQLQPFQCVYITNRTRRAMQIFMNGRFLLTLWPGVTMSSEMTFYGQVNTYTIPRVNPYTRLVVIVQRPMMERCGRFGCFSGGWRY